MAGSEKLWLHIHNITCSIQSFLSIILKVYYPRSLFAAYKMSGTKICLIGAGPSGMSVLYHAEKLRKDGRDVPEVVCFEKQSSWGGLWNQSWRTGLDEFGEPVHSSMYRHLWSNGPKEALEFPDYTFEDHYGKAIPSFPPRQVLFDYLQGRWKKAGSLDNMIHFNHVVRSVTFNEITNTFTIVVKDLDSNKVLPAQIFDYVIVATGHFSTPRVPSLPGIDSFPGRIIHSHDFREAKEFNGMRLLIVGASYSAEDISLQCGKYGAKSITCTWRTTPMGFKWPEGISEKPPLQQIDGKVCHFQDGSTREVDAIILATGYLHHYPFLTDDLRLVDDNTIYPHSLYKGTVWMKGGNGRLMYIGAQNQYYTFTMFDVQALWALKYIIGEIKVPSQGEMDEDWKSWSERYVLQYILDYPNRLNSIFCRAVRIRQKFG